MDGASSESLHNPERKHDTPACEACRRLKMRCTRADSGFAEDGSSRPCYRCERNSRPCVIPARRPLGRRRGAKGKYQGAEKVFRKFQAELRKTREESSSAYGANLQFLDPGTGDVLQNDMPSLIPNFQSNTVEAGINAHLPSNTDEPFSLSTHTRLYSDSPSAAMLPNTQASRPRPGKASNPLALLADASGAAQALDQRLESSTESPASASAMSTAQQSYGTTTAVGVASSLLRRPGCVSLGLSLSQGSLEKGLEAILAPYDHPHQCSDYFKPCNGPPVLDTGPDLDPIDLGLVTEEEARALFPIYFVRLHPINGILDPDLHTPDFVRSRSALLFTWMLAITMQFDPTYSSAAKRLRLHGEKLSKHVHTCGYKSVEIVQGYYISLLAATPTASIADERIWLYTIHAFGLAAELGLDQQYRDTSGRSGCTTSSLRSTTGSPHLDANCSQGSHMIRSHTEGDSLNQQGRLARNRERTWLRMLLWERAYSSSAGRMTSFPETELTLQMNTWWQHPLAISADKFTCAFVTLRQQLAIIYTRLRVEVAIVHDNQHWILELVDKSMLPWRQSWLPFSEAFNPIDSLSNAFLRYVYMHGRLWTLSFALHGLLNGNSHDGDDLAAVAIKQDCFEAAVNCCEVAVRDLQELGERLYCMMTPTWAMVAYAAVLALKLFPSVHGAQPGSEMQLLALLAQVAIELERAGTTPSHRFGIAALLGQHLKIIVRSRLAGIQRTLRDKDPSAAGFGPMFENLHASMSAHEISAMQSTEQLLSPFDPFFAAPLSMSEDDLTEEGFVDILRDLFSHGFGGIS